MIVGLVSSYREGLPLLGTLASAARGCDVVLVAEGPTADGQVGEAAGDPSPLPGGSRRTTGNAVVTNGAWATDAEKRTHLLEWAQEVHQRKGPSLPLWCLWLDGDEVLVWPEYLRDWCYRADLPAHVSPAGEKISPVDETATGGWAIRLVELDGSVVKCYGKIIRGDKVARYLESSYQVELAGGMVVALPNVPICTAGGIPLRPADLPADIIPEAETTQRWLAEYRPPLAGEPHLLHRPFLRHPARSARRLHEAEGEWFPNALEQHGLGGL